MQSLCTLPELTEFAALPAEVRDEVNAWREALESVTRPIQQNLAIAARNLGVSLKTARRNYDLWRRYGWRGLVNRAKVPGWDMEHGFAPCGRDGLDPELIEHWRGLCEANQRKCKPAYKELKRQFYAGRPIPGVPAGDPRLRLPRGWSYANLMRHAPTKFELTVARQGRTASRALAPLVYTTRRNLWIGSHFLFDDVVHDQFVNVLDTRKTGRPVEFHALDLFTAYKFAWGMRVKTENELTGRMETLRGENMRFLVAQVLTQTGYNAERGTEFVLENGAATLTGDLVKLLADLTDNKLTCRFGAMEGDPAFTGQYAGRGKGNFRFKAALESWHNLMHNEFAALPAQTGMDVDRRPVELHGLLKANDALLNAYVALAQDDPVRASWLKFEVMSFEQFLEVAAMIYHRINTRTDHALEGWELDVVPANVLPASRWQIAPSGETPEARLPQVRRLSPAEKWDNHRRELTRFRPEQVALILYRDCAEERSVDRAEIVFQDKALAADKLRFDAARFRDGDKFQCVLNPFAPELLYLFNAKGGFVDAIPRVHRVDRADQEGLARRFGRVAKVYAERVAPVAARGRGLTKERIEQMRHNAAVLGGEGATPQEIEHEQLNRLADESLSAVATETINNEERDDYGL